mgnify:CR=1 FL=1
MPVIVQAGTFNSASLVVPDLYVNVQQPVAAGGNVVSTNRIGIVGTAPWGPVDTPVTIGSYAAYAAAFGASTSSAMDLGTAVRFSALLGANDFRCVRVTDGTDTAATGSIGTGSTKIALTSRYTGSGGNLIKYALVQNTTNTNMWTLQIAKPGMSAESYTVVWAGATADSTYSAFWNTMVGYINNGGGNYSASKILVAAAGNPGAPAAIPLTALTGGTDGGTPATAKFVGADTTPRTGMYALRTTGCALGLVLDSTDTSYWSEAVAFGLSEGVYMMLSGPAGSGYAGVSSVLQTQGIDSYAAKALAGDWLYWYDSSLDTMRLLPPGIAAAARLSQLSPADSGLNKQIATGIVGSQQFGLTSSGQSTPYSSAELEDMAQNFVDVVTNPAPGGAYWALRFGHNTAQDASVWGDNYTRMTFYLAKTFAANFGRYVGGIITPTFLRNVKSAIQGALSSMVVAGLLSKDDAGNLPYSVTCDSSNNPQAQTALGFVRADVAVRYSGIAEKFIINMDAGGTVTISTSSDTQA